MPCDIGFRIRSLLNALVARITECNFFLTMQQTVALGHVTHVARGAANRVYQTLLCVSADMRFHAEVHLLALLARMHIGVAFVLLVLGR